MEEYSHLIDSKLKRLSLSDKDNLFKLRGKDCENDLAEALRALVMNGFTNTEIELVLRAYGLEEGYFTDSIKLFNRIADKRNRFEPYTNKIEPTIVAERISADRPIIYTAGNYYLYEDIEGYYQLHSEEEMGKWIREYFDHTVSVNKVKQIKETIKERFYVCWTEVNVANIINLKTGVLNLNTLKLEKHSPKIYSTIQLNVYAWEETLLDDPAKLCPNFIKFLNQIFCDDQDKIGLVQEFFGLCLTTETKFEKAMFFVGDGANGKSVLLFVLAQLIGPSNRSALSLDQFSNNHYVAELFGKLVNISTETETKSKVSDALFKAIVSGDPIQADPKYKKPFLFTPTVKLIFAVNSLPRVDDKTTAFFRRLIIIKFMRQFKEEEQDKNLKHKLCEELDGIFCWAIAGWLRLKEREHFIIPVTVREEIELYRKENNSVLMFVEENDLLKEGEKCSKDSLFYSYQLFCQNQGLLPFSKIKFGKNLLKAFPSIGEDRNSGQRLWVNVKSPEMMTRMT